jgi:DNA-binding NarL/FixJ family response regulator
MPYNLIFIDESESMQRAVAAIFLDNSEFKLNLVNEPSFLYKAAKNFPPDIIVLSYNTIDTGLKKSITEIKTSKEFSNIPLVLLVPSDLSDNERDTLIKLKSDGFIYRPFDKDAFISKIKRTLSENHAPAHTPENAGNPEEKIYDISSFETKKIPPRDQGFSAAADADSADAPTGGYRISETAPEPPAGGSAKPSYYAESPDGNKEPGAIIDLESSELSQAFENLFKDDAIFKEFQNLNKKEESEGPSSGTVELGGAAGETAAPEEILNPAEPAAASVSFDFSEKQQFEHNFDFKKEEPDEAGNVREEETSVSGLSEAPELASPVESAAPEEILNPAEPAVPQNIGDILELNNSTLPAESGASAFSEPFSGFNTAQDDDSNRFGELKISANINANKSEGELNLKILDEQNLIKLDDYLKNAIEKTFEEIKPQIIETIKNGLPEIIEKLVKEEIEKIKQQ